MTSTNSPVSLPAKGADHTFGQRIKSLLGIVSTAAQSSESLDIARNGQKASKTIHIVTDFGTDEVGLAKALKKATKEYEVEVSALGELGRLGNQAGCDDVVVIDTKFSPKSTLEQLEIDMKCLFNKTAFAGLFSSTAQTQPAHVAGRISPTTRNPLPLTVG